REAVPGVEAVCASGRHALLNVFISMKKISEGDPGRAAAAALTWDWAKNVFVFDDDIVVYNPTEILCPLATRVQQHRQVSIISEILRGSLIDPSMTNARNTSAMIVDATRPLDRPFSPVSKCPDEALARIKLEEFVPGEVLRHIPIDRTSYWAGEEARHEIFHAALGNGFPRRGGARWARPGGSARAGGNLAGAQYIARRRAPEAAGRRRARRRKGGRFRQHQRRSSGKAADRFRQALRCEARRFSRLRRKGRQPVIDRSAQRQARRRRDGAEQRAHPDPDQGGRRRALPVAGARGVSRIAQGQTGLLGGLRLQRGGDRL